MTSKYGRPLKTRLISQKKLTEINLEDVETVLPKYNVNLNYLLRDISPNLLRSLCADFYITPTAKNVVKLHDRIKTLIKNQKEKMIETTIEEVVKYYNTTGINNLITNGNMGTVGCNVNNNSDFNSGKHCTKLKYVAVDPCERLQNCTQKSNLKTKIEHRTVTVTAGKNSVVIQTMCDCINMFAGKNSVVVKTKCLHVPTRHNVVEVKIICDDFSSPATNSNFEVEINCVAMNTPAEEHNFMTDIEYGIVNVLAGQIRVLVEIPDEHINVSAGENNIIVKTNFDPLAIPLDLSTETANTECESMYLPLESNSVKLKTNYDVGKKSLEDSGHFDANCHNIIDCHNVPLQQSNIEYIMDYECKDPFSSDDIVEVIIGNNGENVSVDQSSCY